MMQRLAARWLRGRQAAIDVQLEVLNDRPLFQAVTHERKLSC
jgi:hypothetical protein